MLDRQSINSALFEAINSKSKSDWVVFNGLEFKTSATLWNYSGDKPKSLFPDSRCLGTVSEALYAIEQDDLDNFLSDN